MISNLLHLVGLRPRVYYTLTNFRGRAKAPLPPPPQYANGTPTPHSLTNAWLCHSLHGAKHFFKNDLTPPPRNEILDTPVTPLKQVDNY